MGGSQTYRTVEAGFKTLSANLELDEVGKEIYPGKEVKR